MIENIPEESLALIKSPSFELTLKVLFLFLISIHLGIAAWIARDSASRSSNPFFQILSVAIAVFLPILGLVIYLLIRPNSPISLKIIENFQTFAFDKSCHKCGSFIKEEYEFCPHCGDKLFKKCKNKECGKKIFSAFLLCPYCGKKNNPVNK